MMTETVAFLARDIEHAARELRTRLEDAFSTETAAPGCDGRAGSSRGQCAAAALITAKFLGGDLVSTYVDGVSHWFNRIHRGSRTVDLDITGDQFGRAVIQCGAPGSLYDNTRVRRMDEVNIETLERAHALAHRSRQPEVARQLAEDMAARLSPGTA